MVSTDIDSVPSDALAALSADMAALKGAVAELVGQSRVGHDLSIPDQLREVYQRLIAAHVADDIADRLVRRIRTSLNEHQLQDSRAVCKQLASYIESMLPTAQPAGVTSRHQPAVIALVGPTGVGKTTTVAKLAAMYRLRKNCDVGLITMDTYRIGGIEQLQTYARIIDVPLEVVANCDQMRAAVDRMRSRDIVFIDTVGRSPNDRARLAELAEMVQAAGPTEVHLVLAANCDMNTANRVIQRFELLGVNRLIFTKLDEAVGFGTLLNGVHRAQKRLSYVTTGQEVPNDIEVGPAPRLARLIVDGADGWPADEVQPRMVGAR